MAHRILYNALSIAALSCGFALAQDTSKQKDPFNPAELSEALFGKKLNEEAVTTQPDGQHLHHIQCTSESSLVEDNFFLPTDFNSRVIIKPVIMNHVHPADPDELWHLILWLNIKEQFIADDLTALAEECKKSKTTDDNQ